MGVAWKVTRRRVTRFLRAVARSGNVRRAAKASGIDRSQLYKMRRQDPDLARRWRAAAERAHAKIEDRARPKQPCEAPERLPTKTLAVLLGWHLPKIVDGARRRQAAARSPSPSGDPP